jgi:GTP-binding protein EngB required for normal cell division
MHILSMMTLENNSALNPATPDQCIEGGGNGALSSNLAPDLEKLRGYTKTKLALAGQLRSLREILKRRDPRSRLEPCDQLLAKLAEDRFTLAVIGQFKRGKSSLMNAIIGREILPTGILPLTSAITVLKFGPKERLLIFRSNSLLSFPEEVPIGSLAEYVTEKGNPGNQKRVKTACLELPLPFLRRGLEFVDTPGVGSAIQANTATTYGFLPECDAVLFVTSVDTPFSSVELDLLSAIREHAHKIFFVLNKTDLLGDAERNEVLEFVRKTISDQMGTDRIRVFPVSARLALASKRNGTASAYRQSGLKDLEEALANFLSDEKAAVFLAAIVDRALCLLERESVEFEMIKRARAMEKAAVSAKLAAVQARWREHENTRRRLFGELRQHLLAQVHLAVTPELQSFLSTERAQLSRHLGRVLSRISWQPGGTFSRRLARHELDRLRRRLLHWAVEHIERLRFRTDPQARQFWEQIQSKLVEIPLLAAELLAVARTKERQQSETAASWELNVDFDAPALPGLQWNPKLTPALAALPVRLAPDRFKKQLEREYDRFMVEFEELTLAWISTNVAEALARLERTVGNQAQETESRLTAALSGLAGEGMRLPGAGVPTVDSELESLRNQLVDLRGRLGHSTLSFQSTETPPALPDTLSTARDLEASRQRGHELADLRSRGCPVCDHLQEAAFDFFARWQYALYSDATAQAQFAGEFGFCPLHTWQQQAISSLVGLSVGYAKLIERIAHILREARNSDAAIALLERVPPDPSHCRVCQLLKTSETAYLKHLAAFLDDEQGRSVYALSQGLCLRHLKRLISLAETDQRRWFLLQEAARHFDELAEDMQSYAMKTEALRRGLRNRDEEDAYLRALDHLAGSKHLAMAWPDDIEI